MDNLMQSALHKATNFLEEKGYRYAIIGGIANQIWGQARFTYDIDLKVLVPDTDYAKARKTILTHFPEPARPELPTHSLIVAVKIDDITVDFLLAIHGYEDYIIERAVHYVMGETTFWVCTAEDLIIQKAIAGRAKDWQDIEGILIEQQAQLDQPYLEDWLTQFAEILEKPALLTQYKKLWQQITKK